MNALLDQRPITPDELLAMPDGKNYELVDGQLRERNVGTQSSWVGGELLFHLRNYLRMQPVGLVFPMETGYRCFPGRPRHVRKPDVSFVSTARLPEQRLPLGDMLVAPDLAAEIVSPNDTADEVETKVAEYRSAGVRLIWIVYPPTRTVVIRRLDGSAGEVGPEGTIDGEDVLPGFRCSVAELFRLPIG